VTAVRGNVDEGSEFARLPASVEVAFGTTRFLMTHVGEPEEHWARSLDERSAARRPHVVVCGHSHAPRQVELGGYLFLTPGPGGRRRFGLPLSVALVRIGATRADLTAEIVILESGAVRTS